MAKKVISKRTTFTFNHGDQVEDYGLDVANYEELQDDFDSRAEENLDDVNALIDTLQSETSGDDGSRYIGFEDPGGDISADNTGEALIEVVQIAKDAQAGTIIDNSITDAKLATDVKVGSLASLLTTIKSSVVAAINEIASWLHIVNHSYSETLTSTSWVSDAGEYYYEITDSKVVVNSFVDVYIDYDDFDDAVDLKGGKTFAGYFRLYASEQPLADIVIAYKVVK